MDLYCLNVTVKNNNKYLIICVIHFIVLLSFFSCNPGGTKTNSQQQISSKEQFRFESTVKYAKHFTIKKQGSRKHIVVFDPWKGDTLGNYTLVLQGSPLPDSIPRHSMVIRVPVNNIACLSSTHVGSVILLGERDKITGVSNGDKIWDSIVNKRFKNHQIADIGRSMNNNIEQILALSPDVLMKSGYDNVRSDDARITGANIPIAYNVEWMEPDLLARAEWIKFVSAFFCKEQTADSLFNAIELRYNNALALAKHVQKRPHVLFGLDYKGSWYMAGSESYVAKMLADAGAIFVPNGIKGSQPLSFEQVLDIHADDDIWLNWMTPNISSIEALGKMNERYRLFKAFRNREVYTHDKRVNAAGGNDFWESGVSRPDLLLRDLVKILHPELLPGYETVYWRKIPLTEKETK
jgi:iron complex transport system substrate-binding protein